MQEITIYLTTTPDSRGLKGTKVFTELELQHEATYKLDLFNDEYLTEYYPNGINSGDEATEILQDERIGWEIKRTTLNLHVDGRILET